jgi:hypothetical protein
MFTSKTGLLFYLRKHVKESLFFAQVLFELILPASVAQTPVSGVCGSSSVRARIRRFSDSEHAPVIDVLEDAR